jgi:hypothetical protein
MYVAAPPRILSVFPKGVSMASKATVPTTNKLIILFLEIFCANILHNCFEGTNIALLFQKDFLKLFLTRINIPS